MNSEQLTLLQALLTSQSAPLSLGGLLLGQLEASQILNTRFAQFQQIQQKMALQNEVFLNLCSSLPLHKKVKTESSLSQSKPSFLESHNPILLNPSTRDSAQGIMWGQGFSAAKPSIINNKSNLGQSQVLCPRPLISKNDHTSNSNSEKIRSPDSDAEKYFSPRSENDSIGFAIIRPKPIRKVNIVLQSNGSPSDQTSILENEVRSEEPPKPQKLEKKPREDPKPRTSVKNKLLSKQKISTPIVEESSDLHEKRRLNKLQVLRKNIEEEVEQERKKLTEESLKKFLRVDETPVIKIGESHQAVIPPVTRTPRIINKQLNETWNPEKDCDVVDYLAQLDIMLGDGVSQCKALKLLTRKGYDVKESLRMVKKKRNYYKEFFKDNSKQSQSVLEN